MLLKFSKRGNTLIVSMCGELDHHSAENVRAKIDNKIDEFGIKNLIFDFSDVNFMDSSGIGVVIGRYKKITEYGGRVGIVSLKPNIKRVFELGGLFKIIKEYKNIEEAIESF
ncbi:anti-anti-sigma regulatory factor, SpoIIAA [Caloramator quimbayensis]|uniref:Anti-sigma F factor antagonist n=1 Tax=Caloramator quimbayensis TaxID=1147123 RepID=A0A1T4WQM4_9CLOT|nr:anti-sigma F factor antagonist [Caloramator quimbayensis]SKA79654.1 anti-anti-sigma regulatory factor, SpoIIAA [Caloramator quimbayensis]